MPAFLKFASHHETCFVLEITSIRPASQNTHTTSEKLNFSIDIKSAGCWFDHNWISNPDCGWPNSLGLDSHTDCDLQQARCEKLEKDVISKVHNREGSVWASGIDEGGDEDGDKPYMGQMTESWFVLWGFWLWLRQHVWPQSRLDSGVLQETGQSTIQAMSIYKSRM